MQSETDLRDMIAVALRWWWIIIIPPLLLALAVWCADRRRPPDYQALALVAVTGPNGAPSSAASGQQPGVPAAKPDYPAYPLLATSDDVLQRLLAKLDPPPAGVETVSGLRPLLSSGTGASQSTIKLVVRSGDAPAATRIANGWADVLVEQANVLYRPFSPKESQRVRQQAQEAQAKLAEAEQALAESQSQSRADIVEVQLASAKQELKEALAGKRRVERAIGDAKALLSRISKQPHDAPALAADQLAALLLQAPILAVGDADIAPGDKPASEDATPDRVTADEVTAVGLLGEGPLEIQVRWPDASEHPVAETVSELTASMEESVAALEAQVGEVDAHIATLEQQIVALHGQAEEIDAQAFDLTMERDLARETYLGLAGQLVAMRASGEEAVVEAKVASYASVATRVPRRTTQKVVSAGTVGLLAGVLGAFGVEWWRRAPFHTRLDYSKGRST